MLGTRPEFDRLPINNAPKSHHFTEKLTGRFFVNGSFQKNDVEKSLDTLNKPRLNQNRPLLNYQKKVDEDFIKQSEKLQELENKLAGIKRLKHLQSERDRSRQQRKKQFRAAIIIQRKFRKYTGLYKSRCADALIVFLQCLMNKEALRAAAWAAGVIRRFAIKVRH
jgi:hypothetical protein